MNWPVYAGIELSGPTAQLPAFCVFFGTNPQVALVQFFGSGMIGL
jgi:hypothetical protein